MQNIVQEVLALSKATDAAKWSTAESQVISSSHQLNSSQLVNIAKHFSDNEKGTQQFWQSIDKLTLSHFNSFTVNQAINIIHAFGKATYTPSPQLDKLLVQSWFSIAETSLKRQKEKDPYFESRIVKILRAVSPKQLNLDLLKNFRGDLDDIRMGGGQTRTLIEYNDEFKQSEPTEADKKVVEEFQNTFKEEGNFKLLDLINFK